jgi:thioredoxin reductase
VTAPEDGEAIGVADAADGERVADVADVAIVGGGPAGLAAALELRRLGVSRVVVLEREPEAGGIPRHTHHTGFGLRDLHRVLSGPSYAARYVTRARAAGAELRTSTSVTGWSGARTLELTAPTGRTTLTAGAVILATGCRERPRAARLVPGARPLGVLTTGALQQLVYAERQRVGRRAVIVGAEHVSFSAVTTLAHGGAETVALVTDDATHQSVAPLVWATAGWRRVPLVPRSAVTRIVGGRRVEAIEVTDLRSGRTRRIDCDTVVFTGDWIPDHELARAAGLVMDATRGPRVDCALTTSADGVFAAGNLVHAAEAADVAALSGRHAARAAHGYLRDGPRADAACMTIECRPPLRWISPGALGGGTAPPRGRFVLRVGERVLHGAVEVAQGVRVLWREPPRKLVPGRSVRLDAAWIGSVDRDGPPPIVRVIGD